MTTTPATNIPQIIQGGMGIAVSNWRLARAVSLQGGLGVVSGTAIDTVLVRRLQDGDPDGHVRRALQAFPIPDVATYALRRYFIENGRTATTPYTLLPMNRQHMSAIRQQITMLAAFVEVFLAKEGHTGMVGMNLLTKIQAPTLATLYGAMLAGVDVVLMGAGIPREIPGALDALAKHETAAIKFDVIGAPAGTVEQLVFHPSQCYPNATTPLTRPLFFPIVSAASLAATLARKSNGRVDGFVVEQPTAGGHNAPPRGALKLDDSGQPIYGERDLVDFEAMRAIGLPFWIAGSAGSPAALQRALAEGAHGIQVGTLFAFCDESGFTPDIKHRVLSDLLDGSLRVRTEVQASPTGYPFKVLYGHATGTTAPERPRKCDLGYLREAVRTPEGKTVYRCAAEPVDQYVAKGGQPEDTAGRQCLCNALVAAAGAPQIQVNAFEEPVIVTGGDDVLLLETFLAGRQHYNAHDVLQYLTGSC
jgi:NAD(P)H-dependent flavin oxidoreductase YrpB (nitropropane dioxygenase family)